MRFEPTYEGWKHNFVVTFHRLDERVLSLPMRDGNSPDLARVSLCVTSFEPTYEGWKPPLVHDSTAGRPAF